MSEKSSGGPSVGLLLLIPAAAIIARAATRHHQMLWAEVGESGPSGRLHPRHSHSHFAGPGSRAWAREDFQLPPKIESMLDAWHTRAHEAQEAPEVPETEIV